MKVPKNDSLMSGKTPPNTGLKCLFLAAAICLLVPACDQVTDSEKSQQENPVRIYHENGKLKSEIPVDSDRKRHGVAKQYFSTGQLKNEISYEHGFKTHAIQYYEGGGRHLEFYYKDGKKHGKRTRYWENGEVQSILEYHEDSPMAGLVEYDRNGKKITDYPSLEIVHVDDLDKTGSYIVQVYFSNQSSRAEYFLGQLEDGVFDHQLVTLPKHNDKGVLTYRPTPGTFLMEQVYIIGKYKTPLGNPYFVQKQVNVAIDY